VRTVGRILFHLAGFELSRLLRRRLLWLVWGALAAWAVVEMVYLPGKLPTAARLWALPVIYLAGWALADDLHRGALDSIVSGGVALPQLLYARLVVAVGTGLASLLAISLPVLVTGGAPDRSLVLDLVFMVVYWGAIGTSLGFLAGSGSLAAVGVAGGFVELWWVTGGSVWLTGGAPEEGLRALITVALHLASPFVAVELPHVSSVFPGEWLRLLVALAVVAAVRAGLERRSIFVGGRD